LITTSPLPVDTVLPELLRVFAAQRNAVLQAPPGAGKSTRVPLALLDADWLGDKKIVMLEPRRLAARACAGFMARCLGERIGDTVGYRVRRDTRVGAATRIEVVTEGVLTRMLQDDPALDAVGLVLFDEFHERSLQADLGLALCLDTQAALRNDLRILVMSATLESGAVAGLLGDAPIVTSKGRSYAVDSRYRPIRSPLSGQRRLFEAELRQAVLTAMREEVGSVLVFLPGVAEIRRLVESLRSAVAADVILAPLHGQLDAAAQDTAIRPAPQGKRKLVLATSIAETSLTIEGIRVVIDTGLMRLPHFDPKSGLSRLVTLPVSQAAADQRCGRAGRLAAGVCYRLWPQHQQLLAHSPAEILQADLSPLVLELAQWGVRDATQLRWLDPPPPAHTEQATDLLRRLGAVDVTGRITPHGREMLDMGASPRLAHMMLRGRELGYGSLACELAALLCERDPLRGTQPYDADIARRVELLRGAGVGGDRSSSLLRQVRAMARRWQRQLHCDQPPVDSEDLRMSGVLLAFAYPDRIARRRGGSDQRFVLSNGRGAVFGDAEPLAACDWIVAADLDGRGEARIFLAATIHREHLLDYHGELVGERKFIDWDDGERCVRARRQQRLGQLVLSDEPWQDADPEAVQAAMLQGIRRHAPACLPWTEAARMLQARISFLHRLVPNDWPDVSDASLVSGLTDWLSPYLHGVTRLAQLKRLDLCALLRAQLPWAKQKRLDELAPTHLIVPSGSRIRLDYSHDTPVLAVRLQEMFGLSETPRIAGGRVTVLLHLLSPAGRPVQITQDLSAFWRGSYHQVKKELKGRYPKHHWPDEPLRAPASRTARPRG
jgi:ATP-dependent helicase HrpB